MEFKNEIAIMQFRKYKILIDGNYWDEPNGHSNGCIYV